MKDMRCELLIIINNNKFEQDTKYNKNKNLTFLKFSETYHYSLNFKTTC